VETCGNVSADPCELVLRQIEGAVSAGIPLVQIRERDLEARALVQLVRAAVRIASGSATHIVVNDRADVAMAAGASGVHLREASFRAADVRRLARELLVGRSVHSEAAARDAGPVDYLVAGTVFRTASKGGVTPLGIAGLMRMVAAARGVPVLAIGGIDGSVMPALAEAGVAGVAAIGAFVPGAGEDITVAIHSRAHHLRAAFHRDAAAP
jgi:thiamine-phosphate pyrophosphorylase